MGTASVIVVANEQTDLSEVVREASAVGLTDVQTLSGLPIFSGRIAEERLAELERLENVRSVERDRNITLPPPDSSVQ